jgi:2,5-diketo-D-gluconate reductase A
MSISTVTLNNGVEMPLLGFGVFQVPPEETEQVVTDALAAGYRALDTAAAYRNEEAVGRAVERSATPRPSAGSARCASTDETERGGHDA